jgi:hypothetical protein
MTNFFYQLDKEHHRKKTGGRESQIFNAFKREKPLARCEVLTVVMMKIQVFCHVNWSRDILGELPAFIFRSKRSWAPLTLKMTAAVSSKIPVFTNSQSVTSQGT